MKNPAIIIHRSLLTLLLTLLAATCFIYSRELMQGTATTKMFWMWMGVAGLTGYWLLYQIISREKSRVVLTVPDLLVLGFYIYIMFRSLLFTDFIMEASSLVTLTFLVVLYGLFRQLFSPDHEKTSGAWYAKIFVLVLLISGTGQAIYGLLQLYGFLPSFHGNFKITGTFFNPAPYSGYIALTAIMGLAAWWFAGSQKTLDRVLRYTGITTVVLVLLVLPAAKSRAAWLALTGGALLLLWVKYNINQYIKGILDTRWKAAATIIMLLLLIAGGGYGLYKLKPGSVQGRLLVWKVSSRMVADQPLTGVGYDRFGAEFGNYQAEYFAKENAAQWEKQVAGYEQYALNEYLQIAGETGLVGLLLFLGIIGALLVPFFRTLKYGKQNAANATTMSAASGLIGILIFALFSYPFSIMPLLMVGVFIAAMLAGYSRHIKTGVFKRWVYVILLAIFGAGMYGVVPHAQKQYQAYKKWRQAYGLYGTGNYEMAVKGYTQAYPALKNNGRFLTNYGKALSMAKQWDRGIQILTRARDYHSDPVMYTALGDCYKWINDYRKAEEAYQHAWQIIPSRLYPLYLLAKLHDESNRPEKAIQTARQVLNKEVKIPSTAVEQIRDEMKSIIDENKK